MSITMVQMPCSNCWKSHRKRLLYFDFFAYWAFAAHNSFAMPSYGDDKIDTRYMYVGAWSNLARCGHEQLEILGKLSQGAPGQPYSLQIVAPLILSGSLRFASIITVRPPGTCQSVCKMGARDSRAPNARRGGILHW